jgi:hypothetical protein
MDGGRFPEGPVCPGVHVFDLRVDVGMGDLFVAAQTKGGGCGMSEIRRNCSTPGCFGTMGSSDKHLACSCCRKGMGMVKDPCLTIPTMKERRKVTKQLFYESAFAWLR